jgi:glutathione S-transferase
MLRLYDFLESGNSYKVRLLLTQLGEEFERVPVNVMTRETRRPSFMEKNPNHRIPVLELDDGRRLAESNAILCYLAEGTPYLPLDRWQRAQVLQWMFFEQYSHEPYIAVVRFWHHACVVEQNRAALPEKMERGYHALNVMEQHLDGKEYFVGERYTVADISLFAYTHVAGEGGFDLERYPNVRAWIARVQGQPNHIPITAEVGKLVEMQW